MRRRVFWIRHSLATTETRAVIEQWHGKGRNHVAITRALPLLRRQSR